MNNENVKTAFILSIVSLALSEFIILGPNVLSLFGIFSYFGQFIIALLIAGAPITMSIVALSLIKTAQNAKRVFIILTKIFSIVAISISGVMLLVILAQGGLLSI